MTRLINADEIKSREHDVTLANGAKHRCFDTTLLHEIPTIDAVPARHGKWTRHTLGSTGGYGTTVMHQCSECESMTISRFRYCPNCGARMDEE